MPAHADCQKELQELDACHQVVIELIALKDRQSELIAEQARQLKDMDGESGGGWQWEWFALGLAAGLAGGIALK